MLNQSLKLFCLIGFPKTGQGKEEARARKDERKIWDQQRQVIKRKIDYFLYICRHLKLLFIQSAGA